MGGAGNALLQYLYLTLYIGSHFSKKRKKYAKGVRLTRSWLCFSRTPRVSSGFTHFPAHVISGCAESVDSHTICHTHPLIQWLHLHLTPPQIFFSVPEKEVELRLAISSEYHYGRYKHRGFFSENEKPPWGWGGGGRGYFQFSIMAFTRRLRPKGVSFLHVGLRYMKEKGFH